MNLGRLCEGVAREGKLGVCEYLVQWWTRRGRRGEKGNIDHGGPRATFLSYVLSRREDQIWTSFRLEQCMLYLV